MGWEGYKRTARHDFEEFGCKDFWVELRRLDAEMYGETDVTENLSTEAKELVALYLGGDEEAATKAAAMNPTAGEEAKKASDKRLAAYIEDWNLTHPETNEPLDVPTRDDTSPLDCLPREFVFRMFNWLNEDSAITQEVVKKRKRTSSTTS